MIDAAKSVVISASFAAEAGAFFVLVFTAGKIANEEKMQIGFFRTIAIPSEQKTDKEIALH